MFRGEDGDAGCLDCGRAVRPRLGAVQSGTSFPGLAAASKKFPVEHSPVGADAAGATGAAVDLGGIGREGKSGERRRGAHSQNVRVLEHLPPLVAPSPPPAARLPTW